MPGAGRSYFRMTASGRRHGFIPVASCRWMPKNYNLDESTWRPVFVRFGLTPAHAARRARQAADQEFANAHPERAADV